MNPSSTDNDDGFTQQYMTVKVIYTLNDKDQSPCLHRLPQAQPVNVVVMDDGSRLGAVHLKTCVEEVLKVSPELLPKLKEHDHAVYAYDYSEEDVPTVGQGKLSAILSEEGMDEEAKQIVGRIMKNPMAVFKKQAAETLEVKLKFIALPSDSPLKKRAARPPLLDTSSGTNSFATRLQAAYNHPTMSSPQLPASSSPAYAPDDFHLFPQNTSPASIAQQELDLFLNSPVPSPTLSKAGIAPDLSAQIQSRPPSRMSAQAPTPPASTLGIDPRELSQAEEGPARKRARLEQAPRPRSASAFGTQPRDAPLRRTASTTASIRHFRPHLSAGTQGALGQENDGSNRAPTPRPQRLRNAAPRRMSSMSTLRQAESFDESSASSPPATSPENPSPAFTSSPPLRDFEVYDEGRQDDDVLYSSPLPPYNTFDSTDFNLDEFDMAFSELPDIPSSDFDPHVDIRLGSGPVQDSGIGMMSEDHAPVVPPQKPAPSIQPIGSTRTHAQKSSQQHDRAATSQNTHSRRGSVNQPNQKTQADFAPGEHPLYQQRTTNIAWNSYTPQGGPTLYVQTKTKETKSKAMSAAAWRNKQPKPPKASSNTPLPMSSTPAPSSPMPQEPNMASHAPFLSQTTQVQSAWSPAEDGPSPRQITDSLPQSGVQHPRMLPMTAPTPPESASASAKGKKSPTNRGRAALSEVSGNTGKTAVPRASTPKPLAPAPTSQAWTPGSKNGAKRKRTASKAPSKTTKDKDTPGGRAEKRLKHAPTPLVNDKGERVFCITCGAIESSAWRNLYSKCFPGPESPARLFSNEDKVHVHPNVDAAGQNILDSEGQIRWYTVHKKSLTREEQESDTWQVQKQCNPCGVYFNQNGRLKMPDWGQLAAKDGVQPSIEINDDSRLLEQQQSQSASGDSQQDDTPIDLTMHIHEDGNANADSTRAEADQFDSLFNDHSVDGDVSDSGLRHTDSNESLESIEHAHLKLSRSRDSLPSKLGDADKENMPPPMPSLPSDPANAFDDLPNGDDNSGDFADIWVNGLEQLMWPGEVEEEHELELQSGTIVA